MRLRNLVLTLAILPACLSGCASNRKVVSVEIPQPPAERLTCASEPRVPDTITDTTTAQFVADLAAAGQSCRGQVKWLHDWFATLAKPLPAKE
jgi:uncharacterized protein YceK